MAWPQNPSDDLTLILVGRMREPSSFFCETCRLREPSFFFYEICGLCLCHWNIISYGTSSGPSPNQENSPVVAGSSSPSCTSSSSSPIPAANLDALALLNVVRKN